METCLGLCMESMDLLVYLPMFGLEEPYLCRKVNFVGFSSVLWLVLGFGWKF